MTRTSDGNQVSIEQLRIGDQVLAVDQHDHIISTEIIAMLHYDNISQGK
jgi:hypothetical protein